MSKNEIVISPEVRSALIGHTTVNIIGSYGISGDKGGHKRKLALNCSHSHLTITSCLRSRDINTLSDSPLF